MTVEEKQKTARFWDLITDYIYSGYRSPEKIYDFSDPAMIISGADAVHGKPALRAQPPAFPANDSLEKIAAEIKLCYNCSLGSTRINSVLGEGVFQPLVMVIGEGPGEDEDKQGRPFVGKAGHQLDKMLASINLSRNSNCFITNVVKCRPPKNREPYPEEAAVCSHFLERQISLLKPKFILAAGRVAAQALLKTTEPISKMRGKFINFTAGGLTIPLIVTYHPAALLRNESLKRPTWEDLKLLRSMLLADLPADGGS